MKVLTHEEMALLRATSIGGSDAPPIMRESPFATPLEVWARKKKLIPPQAVTARMLRGLRLEPIARERYETETGIPMPARVVRHPEVSYRHASLDGRNTEARGALEIKAPGAEDHIEALKGNVPSKYIWQCVHNLAADPNLDWIDYYSFNPDFDGPETARIRVTRTRRLERELAAAEADFYRFMQTNTPPPPGPKELPWPWPKYALNQTKGELMQGELMQGNEGKLTLATAREVVETIQRLRALGVRNLDMIGLEFGAPQTANSANQIEASAAAVMSPPPRGPACTVCGDEMQPSKYERKDGSKYYCVGCFKRRQDAKKRDQRFH